MTEPREIERELALNLRQIGRNLFAPGGGVETATMASVIESRCAG